MSGNTLHTQPSHARIVRILRRIARLLPTDRGRYPTGGATIVNVFPVVQPNDIYMDGDKLTDKVGKRMANNIRRHGGPIKWG